MSPAEMICDDRRHIKFHRLVQHDACHPRDALSLREQQCIPEPSASWGDVLTAAQNIEYLRNDPWLPAPGAAIFITVLAHNFLGDGLRDAVDTKM